MIGFKAIMVKLKLFARDSFLLQPVKGPVTKLVSQIKGKSVEKACEKYFESLDGRQEDQPSIWLPHCILTLKAAMSAGAVAAVL